MYTTPHLTPLLTLFPDAQISEPYIRLCKGHVSADRSLLVSISSTPFETFFVALRHRYLWVATLGVMTVLAEVLTIVLPTIPFNASSYYSAWRVSTFMAMAIISVGILLLFWVFVRKHMQVRALGAEAPATIAEALRYLCASHMMADFAGMSCLSTEESNERIRHLSKFYSLGWSAGVDDNVRWMIDHD